MLTIRSDQMRSLREGLEAYQRDQTVLRIVSQLCHDVPKVMDRYAREQHLQFVRDVLDATGRFGIIDTEQLLNWSYIRFVTNIPFYEAEQFKDILQHPLLHPDAKGRHIVLAFFAIQRMQRDNYRPWPQ